MDANCMGTKVALTGVVLAIGLCSPARAAETIEFNREIRPILSDNCFKCHGPDSAARKKNLRFDLEEGLLGKTDEGLEIVVPGRPNESELYKRISHPDVDKRMPHKDSHLELTPEEIALLKRWIEEGAPWEGHWAFVPPVKPDLPSVSDESWARNEIDSFIASRLDAAGLRPSDEARKETLIRRVSLDLTGLPPTPGEVDAFVADSSDDPYEKVVDRLLASPHYGERMSFVWLDAARYSDTNGYQRDTKRYMWHWRDWVIKAFNDNMPFDQFTIEQLAGDLLPNATLSQKVATGFNRNHRINGEGGIIPEEYAVEYVVDRIETTSSTWMGLTMGCARCHEHKFDPFSQKEFYELYAFFDQVPENGKGEERGNDKPFIQVPTPEETERKAQLTAKIGGLEKELFAPDDRLDALQVKWERELKEEYSALNWRDINPTEMIAENGATLEILEDSSILVSGANSDKETYEISFEATEAIRSLRLEILMDERLPESGPGRAPNGNVVLTDVEITRVAADAPNEAEVVRILDAIADYSGDDRGFGIGATIDDDDESGWTIDAHIERENRTAVFILDETTPIEAGDKVFVTFGHDSKYPTRSMGRFRLSHSASGDIGRWARPVLGPWHHVGPLTSKAKGRLLFEAAFPPEEGYDNVEWEERLDWTDGKVISFEEKPNSVNYLHRTVQVGAPTNLTFSLGSDDAIKVWIDGQVELSNNVARGAAAGQESISVFLPAGDHEILIKIVNFGGNTGYYFKADIDEGQEFFALVNRLETPEQDRSDDDRKRLRSLFRMQDAEWLAKRSGLDPVREDLAELERGIVTTMIMEDMETRRDTYLLKRGAYDNPDTSEKLFPSVPSSLGEMDAELPKNRLGLAQWLMDPEHPLTARVRVNHYWQMYFGRGLVRTSEDFGTQGLPASHPELLDWLAIRFVESGWDVKAMQKLIVMSATYRQSSVMTRERAEKDPENILLSHAPRFRLPAEMIRDQALKISGLLNEKIGGPSVKPYQPENMWSSLSFQNMDEFSTNFYTPDTGEDLYRRELYTYWKRTIGPPRMQIFNASDRESCSLRQENTNTPMQAMVLLNDPTFIEASRHLAQRMILEGGDRAGDRIRYGYKLVLAYEPGPAKQRILLAGLSDYQSHFIRHAEEAKDFITVGESEPDKSIAEAELAAYTMLASVMFNLDEAITRE